MCELVMSPALVRIAERGTIRPHHVDEVREEVFPDGLPNKAAAETLLAIDMAAQKSCTDWETYLRGAIADFIARAEPDQHDNLAQWLIRCISRHGCVDDPGRFDMLLAVIEALPTPPYQLVRLALSQVETAILEARGPLAQSRLCDKRVITSRDVASIRTILLAVGDAPLSREEMQFLFDLNEQTFPHANHGSWQDLFVKAVANHVLSEGKAGAQPRSIALAADQPADKRVKACVAKLRSAGSDAPYRLSPESGANGPNTPAQWVINRYAGSSTFRGDCAAAVAHVTQMMVRNPGAQELRSA